MCYSKHEQLLRVVFGMKFRLSRFLTCLDRYNQSGASDFEFECYSPFTDLAFVLEFPSALLDWLSLVVPLFSFLCILVFLKLVLSWLLLFVTGYFF